MRRARGTLSGIRLKDVRWFLVLVITIGISIVALAPRGNRLSDTGRYQGVSEGQHAIQTVLLQEWSVGFQGAGEPTTRDIVQANVEAAVGLPRSEKLDINRIGAELNHWAEHVRRETDRHFYRFQADPSSFENSEAYFRTLMMIVVLQENFGVRYNPERIDTPATTAAIAAELISTRAALRHQFAGRSSGTSRPP